ncbi:MAG: hypothetical protein KGL39_30625 [Patescibacteria group bacterium]|nr:hypothetical protein [Patescibacteria group bacterium]
MNLISHISMIQAGGPGSGCHGPNCGRPATGRAFVSPNTAEGGTFEDAARSLSSPEQRQFVNRAKGLLAEHGGGSVTSAIGDWSDGAESSAVMLDHGDRETRDYMAAELGMEKDQKAVLTFNVDRNGTDAMHMATIPASPADVRGELDNAGVTFRTLVPMRHGQATRLMVYDGGNELASKVAKVGEHYGVHVSTVKGSGTFIGGNTREEANAAYQKVISDYEGHHGKTT